MNNPLIQYLNKYKYITIFEPQIQTTNDLRKLHMLVSKQNLVQLIWWTIKYLLMLATIIL